MELNKIYNGNCLDVLKECADNFFDSVVTDPPYGLSFMGKHWDYDVPKVEIWKEIIRVLKPGGHLLCACGTRTQHRMAVNIEDAGFEIRDVITWHYGSGFPKSLDISKAIDKQAGAEREVVGSKITGGIKRPSKALVSSEDYDENRTNNYQSGQTEVPVTEPKTDEAKQWEGWGTALKPATEFWTLARKPLSEKTVAENVLKYGTGGINIDGSRIGTDEITNKGMSSLGVMHDDNWKPQDVENTVNGRFPANVIFGKSFSAICILDGKVSVDLQELISNYYGKEYLSRVQQCLRNISEQVEGWKKQVLQQEMLSQKPFKDNGGGKPSNVRKETQAGIFEENDTDKNSKGKEGQRESDIQGISLQQRLQVHKLSGTIGGSPEDSFANDAEKRNVNTGTSVDNGNEIREAVKDIGTRSPQERGKGRQQAEELGGIEQHYSQDAAQGYSKRIEDFEKAKRGIIVFDADLPEVFRKYFTETDLEIEHFNSPGKILDEQSGVTQSKSGNPERGTYNKAMFANSEFNKVGAEYDDIGGSSRFFYCPKADNFERNKGLKGIPTKSATELTGRKEGSNGLAGSEEHGNSTNPFANGGSVLPRANHHPTVKPIDLMRYLVRLITPKGGIVLDPFNGSGTTGIAAKLELMKYVGIEMDEEYCKISEARIAAWNPDKYKPQQLF